MNHSPDATGSQVYVETGVAMASDHGVAAWVFDLETWGRCGQGVDETSALADLGSQLRPGVPLTVVERINGDEQVFVRDRSSCTQAERRATLAVLDDSRRRTRALVRSCSDAVLDWDDPDRMLPPLANWRTIRQLAWHVADTESRYYLPRTGLGYRDRATDLTTELDRSAAYVRAVVASMPAAVVRAEDGEIWTSVKVLRRLAWHERGELAVMEALAERATRAGVP